MSEFFIFDGIDCRDYCVHVFDRSTYGGSSREYDGIIIPGKSGNVLIDRNRYENISNVYDCIIYENAEYNLDEFREFLMSRSGYKRLEDSIHIDEFYLACFKSDFQPVLDRNREMAKVQLSFERKPQRFLKIGEFTTTYTENSKIHNPTQFSSKPLIRIYGNGNVGIGETTITLTGTTGYTDIDCDVCECFNGTELRNSKVRFSGVDFPVLHSGENGITLGSGITMVDITPRWFKM